jgi:aspartyl-tRNA(Asn)/glutamyl-tRNA(Gln) amidotransferase subunit A
MADAPLAAAAPMGVQDLILGVPKHFLLEDLDPDVANAWARTLGALSKAGARIEVFEFPELETIPEMNARGTISNAEAFAYHRRAGLLAQRGAYDPNVLARVELGAAMSAADYLDLLAARSNLITIANARTARFDAVISPTVPILAPRIDAVAAPETFARLNALTLRNPSVANLLDRCAISLPMRGEGAPCGLMLMGETLGDAKLMAVAKAVESAL